MARVPFLLSSLTTSDSLTNADPDCQIVGVDTHKPTAAERAQIRAGRGAKEERYRKCWKSLITSRFYIVFFYFCHCFT